MTAHRFFLTAPLADDVHQPVPLTADDVRHALGALRVRPGESIDLVDPAGRIVHLEVTACDEHSLYGRVTGEATAAEQPRVTLFQAVAKGEKMDEIVRRAVELGAERIVPLLTRRCVVKLDARKRADRGARWRRVSEAAAKQSKRASIPDVSDPIPLADAVPLLAAYDAAVVLWEEHEGSGLMPLLKRAGLGSDSRVALVVGPEGGLDAEEIADLVACGAEIASLGPLILRTETAAIVSLALTTAALGGLGGSGE